MDKAEQAGKMKQIISKARVDNGYRQKLLSNPGAVLQEEGLEIPPGVEVKIVENTDKVFHLVLPVGNELSEDALAAVAGGTVEYLKFYLKTVYISH